jgi:hypothetical protein
LTADRRNDVIHLDLEEVDRQLQAVEKAERTG